MKKDFPFNEIEESWLFSQLTNFSLNIHDSFSLVVCLLFPAAFFCYLWTQTTPGIVLEDALSDDH